SMADHAAPTHQACSEQHTVLTRDRPTDCAEGTVGENEPQPLEKSGPDTVHTEHTVFSPITEGECLQCAADHVTLVQRQGKPACVEYSLPSDDELVRMRPPRPSNGTHA